MASGNVKGGKEGKEKPKSPLAGLAHQWEQDEVIRRQALASGSLLVWPTKQLTGVVTFQTMALNTRVLKYLLNLWCPAVSMAQTVRIDHVRDEAGCHIVVRGFVMAVPCCSRSSPCAPP